MHPAPPRPLAPGARTHDWARFLGPTGDAHTSETPLRARLGPIGPPVVWETPKGEGYATPAVIGGRVFLFHRLGRQETLTAFDALTGKRLWNAAHPTAYFDRYGYGGGPRCQPVGDAGHVVSYGVEGVLSVHEPATGKLLWRRDLLAELRGTPGFFGVGATPLLDDGRLVVHAAAGDGSRILALDPDTGKTLWSASTPWGAGYASPVPVARHGRRFLLVFAGGESRPPTGGLLCLDPATGKILGQFPWRARRFESVNASTPLVIGSQVFVSECYGMGGALLDLLPDGSLRPVWTSRALGTHFMTAIHRDGFLYGVDGHGPYNAPLVCVDLKTGKERWRTEPEWPLKVGPESVRRMPARASLLQTADGRCLALGEFGHLAWLDLNPAAYREVDRAQLFAAEQTWSMPALSRGLLYVCQNDSGYDGSPARLLCLDLRGEKA